MLTSILLHELTDYRSHLDAFRTEESNNHLNQKKENDDSRHILFHNLKRHNENHLHNNKKMIQADQHTQSSESIFLSVSQENVRLRQNQFSNAQNALKLKCISSNSTN